MPVWLQVVIVIIIVAAALLLGLRLGRRRRSEQLRTQFGPEYDRTVAERGDRQLAETELDERRRRREDLDIRPLEPTDRARFAEEWRVTQLHFVDNPETAMGEADRLVGEVMRARGYPVDDFEQRAADVSVDHPTVVENYRSGHAIAERHAAGTATTEDLRQAMVHYRALFDDLLGERQPEAGEHDRDRSGTREHDQDRGGRGASDTPTNGKHTEVT